MDRLATLGLLVAAATLEAAGDAVVRLGLGATAWLPRGLMFLGGAALLFLYGLSLNLAPVEFGRVVGLYVAVLFVVWQAISFVAFRSLPDLPSLAGGALIIIGGGIVTLWGR